MARERRRRDLDNLLAAFKPAWDGFIDAGLLSNDHAAALAISMRLEVRPVSDVDCWPFVEVLLQPHIERTLAREGR